MSTLVKPINSLFGVTTELTRSVIYTYKQYVNSRMREYPFLLELTWTTSLPSIEPELWTVTVTLKSSFVPIVERDSCKSVLRGCVSTHQHRERLDVLIECRVTQTATKAPRRNGGVEDILQDHELQNEIKCISEYLPGVQTGENRSCG